jgi:hypothetical protein
MPAYPNRTDLNQPKPKMAAFTNQTYGEQANQVRRQRVVKPGPPPGARVPAPGPAQPGAAGAFNRPTERPNEPVTAGAPFGPGAGPEALSGAGVQAGSREDVYLQVRAIASRYPNPAVLDLLQTLERRMIVGQPRGTTPRPVGPPAMKAKKKAR